MLPASLTPPPLLLFELEVLPPPLLLLELEVLPPPLLLLELEVLPPPLLLELEVLPPPLLLLELEVLPPPPPLLEFELLPPPLLPVLPLLLPAPVPASSMVEFSGPEPPQAAITPIPTQATKNNLALFMRYTSTQNGRTCPKTGGPAKSTMRIP
jgi:hypothetical protein